MALEATFLLSSQKEPGGRKTGSMAQRARAQGLGGGGRPALRPSLISHRPCKLTHISALTLRGAVGAPGYAGQVYLVAILGTTGTVTRGYRRSCPHGTMAPYCHYVGGISVAKRQHGLMVSTRIQFPVYLQCPADFLELSLLAHCKGQSFPLFLPARWHQRGTRDKGHVITLGWPCNGKLRKAGPCLSKMMQSTQKKGPGSGQRETWRGRGCWPAHLRFQLQLPAGLSSPRIH